MLDLKSPDPAREEKEIEEIKAYYKKNRKKIENEERERLERKAKRGVVEDKKKEKISEEKDDKDPIVEAVTKKLSIGDKILKASAVVDYYERFLENLKTCTSADFSNKSKDVIIESLNKLNFLSRNPFISDELQLKTFEEYKRLITDLIKDGIITHTKNGFIFPGAIGPFGIIPEIFFPKISEEDRVIELFDTLSSYKNEIQPGIVYEKALDKKSDEEIEKLYDTLKEYKHRFKPSEVVLSKLDELREYIFSGEILKDFKFENPLSEGVRKLKSSYNDQYKKIHSGGNLIDYTYFFTSSFILTPINAIQIFELVLSRVASIFF